MSSMAPPTGEKTTSIEKKVLEALASLPPVPAGKQFDSVTASMKGNQATLVINFK